MVSWVAYSLLCLLLWGLWGLFLKLAYEGSTWLEVYFLSAVASFTLALTVFLLGSGRVSVSKSTVLALLAGLCSGGGYILFMKALETEAHFEVVGQHLGDLEKLMRKYIDITHKLGGEIGELKKAVEEKERKVEKAQGEKKPKAVAAGEEVVEKAESKTYESYPDSSFVTLHRILREIK